MNLTTFRYLLFLLLGFGAIPAVATATTYLSEWEKCPVCGEKFINGQLASWFQFAEPDRDFGGSMFAAFEITTCPYCLYSAEDFGKLTRAERRRVRAALAHLPAELPGGVGKAAPRGDRAAIESCLPFQIALLCNAQRDPKPARDASLALVIYYRFRTPTSTREAVRGLEAWLESDPEVAGRADMVYLLGELQRRLGRMRDAAAHLRRAEAMAKGGDRDIARWASEQRRLAERGISKSNDRHHASGSLHAEESRKLRPRIGQFLAAIKRGRPAREWLLPTKGRDPVHETLNGAIALAESGDRRAVEFILRWLAQVAERELDDFPEPYCLEALAEQRTVAKPLLPGITFRFAPMEEAVRYACGAGPAPARTRAALRGKVKILPTDKGVLKIATHRRDPIFKDLLLSRAVSSEDWGSSDAEGYLDAVCTPSDIPAIERRIRSISMPFNVRDWTYEVSHRIDLQDILRTMRMRRLAGMVSGDGG